MGANQRANKRARRDLPTLFDTFGAAHRTVSLVDSRYVAAIERVNGILVASMVQNSMHRSKLANTDRSTSQQVNEKDSSGQPGTPQWRPGTFPC